MLRTLGDALALRADLRADLRAENRTNATEQGMFVAAAILGDGDRLPYRPVPYFWTDQFGTRIQVYGTPSADAEFTVVEGSVSEGAVSEGVVGEGAVAGRRFVGVYRDAGSGAVTGVLGWRMPKQARLRRQELADAYAGLAPVP